MQEVSYASVDRIVADAPEGMTKFKIEVDAEHHVGLVTLNRPEKLNAFSMGYPADQPRPEGWTLFDQYMRAVTQELKFDKRIRVVVVTGAGRAFSAGADIKDWSSLEQKATSAQSPFTREGLMIDESTAMMAIWFRHLMKPTIAMVNGPAVGMGADLAASCDMRVMSDDAFFQWAYVLNGLPPVDGGTWLLPRIVGQAKALEWMLTGQRVSASDALQWGLANHVVAADALYDRTMTLAQHIAKSAPNVLQAIRFGVETAATLPMQESVGMSYMSAMICREDIRRQIVERAAAI